MPGAELAAHPRVRSRSHPHERRDRDTFGTAFIPLLTQATTNPCNSAAKISVTIFPGNRVFSLTAPRGLCGPGSAHPFFPESWPALAR